MAFPRLPVAPTSGGKYPLVTHLSAFAFPVLRPSKICGTTANVMKNAIVLIALISLFPLTATAAPMLRVVGVTSAHTIVVDRNGIAAELHLAGVTINPNDEAAAIDFLRSKLVGSWVLVETDAAGGSYVYRSPDSLFVNGALSQGTFLEPHTKMTYLGESFPGPRQQVVKKTAATPTVSILPPAKPHRVPTSPKGAHRIPRFPKM